MKRSFSVIAAVGLTLCGAAGVRAQQTYVLTDIAPGGASRNDTNPIAINNSGTIAGYSPNPSGTYGATVPFVWKPATANPVAARTSGSPTYLALPKGTIGGGAVAINNLGQIAGYATKNNAIDAVRWETSGAVATLVSNAWPHAINDSGQVVGSAIPKAGGPRYPFLWSAGKTYDLSKQGAKDRGVAINAGGQVLCMDGYNSTFLTLWNPTTLNGTTGAATLLPLYWSGDGRPFNDAGLVVGMSTNDQGATVFGVVASPGGTVQALPVPAGWAYADPTALSNAVLDSQGQVVRPVQVVGLVGNAAGDAWSPFIWDSVHGTREFMDPSQFTLRYRDGSLVTGWQLGRLAGINDAGQIVGEAINPSGQPRLVLLTPQ